MKQGKLQRQQLEDERDRSVETDEFLSTESNAAANSSSEATSSNEVSEPEFEEATEMESTAPGNLKLDAICGPRDPIDEGPNKSDSQTDNLAETALPRTCHEHANNLATEAVEEFNEDLQYSEIQAHVKFNPNDKMKEAKQLVENPINETNEATHVAENPTNDLVFTKQSYTDPAVSRFDNGLSTWVPSEPPNHLPCVSNTPNKLVKKPEFESLYAKQSHTEPAASRLDYQLDWQTGESAKVEEVADELKPKNEQLRGLSFKTVDNVEPLNPEECKNQANADFSSETFGEKLTYQSDKFEDVKNLADYKMIRPTQANQMFYEDGDNLHEEALKLQDPKGCNREESADRKFNTTKNQSGQPKQQGWDTTPEGTIEMEKKNRGSTAKITPSLVRDIARSTTGQSGFPENIFAIHDFCLGIPYGCLLIAESLLWFIATWRTSPFYTGVLLGGLILASSISSLKAWSEGCSSRTQMKAQAALAFIICARALPDVLKTKLLFPNAVVCIISAAMTGFYAYMYFFGKNVQEEKY
ncbi:hypothetical protein O6H91_13G101800 [Diphasiastrum complanatum]|nr:hypothetical protein O6H91_13G101800 [Diphasiastrum complanatum]KAJ7534598.1 hypothetical protein O6H91_13G101800 [Diphasiastrum complanatum]